MAMIDTSANDNDGDEPAAIKRGPASPANQRSANAVAPKQFAAKRTPTTAPNALKGKR
jgi:hypothetical protein